MLNYPTSSSSSSGMFAGIMFLITTFVSMGMYTIFETLRNNSSAMMVFGVVDLLMFSTALIACIIGLWRLKNHAKSSFSQLLMIIQSPKAAISTSHSE